jgi:thiol:disulfide interchange protein DsbD
MLVLSVGALALMAYAGSFGTGPEVLRAFTTALNKAESLQAAYTVTMLGGASNNYDVALAKPNKARIETDTQLTIADGTTITVFDKKNKTYFKRNQTDAELKALFDNDATTLWSGFFDEKAFDKGIIAKSLPDKVRKGIKFKVVEVAFKDNASTKWTFYIDPSDSIAKQAELNLEKGTKVLDVKSVGTVSSANVFAFSPPSDSKEVKEEDLHLDRWYTNLEEAREVARKTNRLLMVDFYADWCGPCKMLMRDVFPQESFKKMAKWFVFVKINGDYAPNEMQRYGVTAFPTIKFMRPDDTIVHEIVGYRPVDAFVAEMEKAKASAGIGG